MASDVNPSSIAQPGSTSTGPVGVTNPPRVLPPPPPHHHFQVFLLPKPKHQFRGSWESKYQSVHTSTPPPSVFPASSQMTPPGPEFI
ncbi:uncharacterized protein PGTG_00269 [Puccinia graminis f. sp. tritici CRL 75-36-700-3]|uniref:Uncharacterized protein n=1 Tax=Puccinia graminis f. sp. tritici (strain CRL 75-36-700-3 / race SCCL) TaxID=418459 RepID=E3JQU1_PUCGT|nr:uncharacterized protein PGTG_00269 [Puccinia graminis f. sp. tritici CRL 75-36-700-3]EFP74313.2 hypothetical protein PGTG_00269 [Puccinia graminis f. sp. tritici CRL 75-36-700-3]